MNVKYKDGKLYSVGFDESEKLLEGYSKVYNETEGLFCVGIGTDPITGFGGKYGFINNQGEMVIKPVFDYARPFHDGLALISIGRDKSGFGGSDGFIDNTGKIVIEPQYSEARDFVDGVAVIGVGCKKFGNGGKWGLINKNGDYVILPQYTYIGAFFDKCAWVQLKSTFGYINTKGEQITPLKFSNVGDFHEGLAAVKEEKKCGLYGYINTNGEYHLDPSFEKASNFKNGIAIVKKNKKYGIINKQGTFLVEPIYDEIKMYGESVAIADRGNNMADKAKYTYAENITIIRKNGKYGLLNDAYEVVLEPKYDGIRHNHDDLAEIYITIKKNNTISYKHGFIDETGKIVIPVIYDNVSIFKNDECEVRLGDKVGRIDKKGNWVK